MAKAWVKSTCMVAISFREIRKLSTLSLSLVRYRSTEIFRGTNKQTNPLLLPLLGPAKYSFVSCFLAFVAQIPGQTPNLTLPRCSCTNVCPLCGHKNARRSKKKQLTKISIWHKCKILHVYLFELSSLSFYLSLHLSLFLCSSFTFHVSCLLFSSHPLASPGLLLNLILCVSLLYFFFSGCIQSEKWFLRLSSSCTDDLPAL